MEKLDGLSMDIAVAEQDKLRAVFPQCFVEGKLDERKLLELLGTFDTLDENDREKYEFRWKGKQEALQLAGKRSAGTLRPCPCPEESVDWENTRNLYIEGDNLEVLKLLQTSYYRKVKMIYIDPPYNTGNDFVYNDDFADPLARYREVTQQTTKSNPETMGRFHTNWLNMMYPRLRLAANLLRDDGVIFISIDDNEAHNLRKLCDEIFGEENYIQEIIWEKKYAPQNDAKYFSLNHETLLCYARNRESFQRELLPMTDEQKSRYKNPDNDPRGPWKSSDLTRAEFRERDYYPIIAPSGRETFPATGRSWNRPPDEIERLRVDNRLWFGETGNNVPSLKRFLSETKQGMVPISIWSHNEVGHTQSASQELVRLFGNKKPFDFPKPVGLIKRCIQLATGTDSIILDFFSGSATTAHAVMQLNAEDGGNRRFILVQLPEVTDETSEAAKAGYANICEIGKERIRRAGAKLKNQLREQGWDERNLQVEMQDVMVRNAGDVSTDPNVIVGGKLYQKAFGISEAKWVPENEDELNAEMAARLDTGFRVFKLDTSNLKVWDDTPLTGDDAIGLFEQRMLDYLDVLVPGRTPVEVAYEVMLKLGEDLCEPIVEIPLDNERVVYGVGEGVKFIVCLAPGITPEDAAVMAEHMPKTTEREAGRVIFAEQCFENTEQKSNVRLTLKDKGVSIKTL